MTLPSTPLERLSKTVFGQSHRLSVMAWIARSDGLVNPGEVAEAIGRAQSAVQGPFRDLTDAGLLVRLPVEAGRTYYQRVDSNAWPFALELVSAVENAPASHEGLPSRGRSRF